MRNTIVYYIPLPNVPTLIETCLIKTMIYLFSESNILNDDETTLIIELLDIKYVLKKKILSTTAVFPLIKIIDCQTKIK